MILLMTFDIQIISLVLVTSIHPMY